MNRRSLQAEIQHLAKLVATQLGLRTRFSIRISEGDRGPLVVGALHPVVYLPRRARDEWSHQAVEHVLAHELGHVVRRDLWLEHWFAALSVAYWFHPGVWYARREAHALREMCCDATAFRAAGPGYRATLVRLSAELLLQPDHAGVASLGARPARMLTRLRALESKPTLPSQGQRLRTASVFLLGASLLIPMAARQATSDLDWRVAEARAQLDEMIHGDGDVGSLHVRYAVMRLRALEEEQTAGEKPQPPPDP